MCQIFRIITAMTLLLIFQVYSFFCTKHVNNVSDLEAALVKLIFLSTTR